MPLSQNAESSSDLLLNKNASQFSSEVIDKWITMQLRLDRDAVGIPNDAFSRYYAYSGVAAFAAVAQAHWLVHPFSAKLNRLTNLPQANGLTLALLARKCKYRFGFYEQEYVYNSNRCR